MKVLHILEDYSTHSGGLRTVVKNLDNKLRNAGNHSFILTSNKDVNDEIYGLISNKNKWLYSKDWKPMLYKVLDEQNIEIIHIHGVWMYPQYIAAKVALEKKVPFLITPHGMYEPWLWKKNGILKRLYFSLISKPVFKKANVVHAITEDEQMNLNRLFINNRIVAIPNLIDPLETEYEYSENSERYILYLGRLDSKKGIDLLIKAFHEIHTENVKLKIAGGFNSYKAELEQLVSTLGMEHKVEFLGMVTGKQKIKLFTEAFLFAAPSHSEVIGMVNLEAASCGTPVLTTFQTGIHENWAHNGGFLINPKLGELKTALSKALSMTLKERIANGALLKSYVLQEYSWDSKYKNWDQLYKSIVN